MMVTKQKMQYMKDKVQHMKDDVAAYQDQSDVFEANLDSLLKINEMYQDTIRQLEQVIQTKERIITDHLNTISKLTEGSSNELKDIKMMFFSKQQELVDQIQMWRNKHNEVCEKQRQEIEIRDAISNRLNGEIQDLKEELLIAKRILKDPQLSQLASRKFKETIE